MHNHLGHILGFSGTIVFWIIIIAASVWAFSGKDGSTTTDQKGKQNSKRSISKKQEPKLEVINENDAIQQDLEI